MNLEGTYPAKIEGRDEESVLPEDVAEVEIIADAGDDYWLVEYIDDQGGSLATMTRPTHRVEGALNEDGTYSVVVRA